MFGLSVDTLRDIKETFSTLPQIDKVLLYGSRAKGNYRSGSDIDISLIGKNLTTSNAIYPLQDKLDALYLAYQFDISIFEQLDNSALIKDILDTGQVFYQKEKDLPKDWAVKPLGEVCEVANGGTPKTNVKDYWNGDILWTTPKDMGKLTGVYSNDTLRRITKKGLKNSSAKLIPRNCVILSSRAPIGHLLINTEEMAFNQGCKGLIPKNNLDNKYLFYFLYNSIALLNDLGSGTTFKEISGKKIKTLKILTPPLATQQKIVAVLDKTFKQIDKAITNTKQNLQNTQDLFDSYLQNIFESLDGGWKYEQLKKLGTLTSSKRIYKKEYVEEGIPFYRSKEIKELGNNKEISLELFIAKERYLEIKSKFGVPKKGDILLTAVGTIGEMYIVDENENFYFKDGNIMWLKDFCSLDARYLKFALTFFVEKLKSMSRGSAYSALTIEKLKEHSIPVPTKATQQKIVKKLDALSIQTQTLKQSYTQKLESLKTLKKSLLEKAFSGGLV